MFNNRYYKYIYIFQFKIICSAFIEGERISVIKPWDETFRAAQ